MKNLSIYLAHPLTGLAPEEVTGWYESNIKALTDMGYTVYDPVTMQSVLNQFKSEKLAAVSPEHLGPISCSHAIFERDKWSATKTDVVLIDLTGAKSVSIGCTMELAWASLSGRHTVVVMEDVNPHRHSFVLEAADVILRTLDEALQYLYILNR